MSTDQPRLWSGAVARPAREFATTRLRPTRGAVPAGLRGTLYRNGPARLARGGMHVGHWFDGDGAVLRVRFQDGAAEANYRYVRSDGFRREEAAGRLLYGNYGMTAPGPIWNHWRRPLKNAANTSVIALNDRLLALWEGGGPHALDFETLATRGLADLAGPGGERQSSEPFSAHPKQDPATGDIYNFGVAIPGPRARLVLYRCDRGGRLRAKGHFDLDAVPLIHDWILAGPYLVFLVPPVRVSVLPVLLGRKSYGEAMRWRPDLGTQILVFERSSLDLVARGETEPGYQWHFGNGACADGGWVVLDHARYADFSTNQHLREVASGRTTTPAEATLWRMTLDPKTARVEEHAQMSPRSVEFPMVLHGETGRPWRRTYMAAHRPGTETTAERYDTLACFDHVHDHLTLADLGDGRYPSEPVVVPDAEDPSRHWLISVVYDGRADAGEVWIYDAAALAAGPVCILALPDVVPLSFHGCWRPASTR
ncbi:carotenoid oxygenase family protein [uncultured Thiohalocapsa sp.]|uniref:carotenoid oxygenase family protein n=1 Tax=uncultured Thiohalocapsa sp. TaxID=768990 RepID=UPI0025EF9B6A|nr:carotenoid oxygenase family protein [uncultured Thiohalocapsa sp.]